jgi:hemoglobin
LTARVCPTMLVERNKMVRNVPAWCVEQTGGPKCYPGRDMREAHAHLAVTEREFDVVATEIKTTLYQLKVPAGLFDLFWATI